MKKDARAELIMNTETDVLEISIANKTVMSGMWSENLRKVFQRALSLWEGKIEE